MFKEVGQLRDRGVRKATKEREAFLVGGRGRKGEEQLLEKEEKRKLVSLG